MRRTDLIIPGPNSEVFELDDEHPLTSRVFVAPLRAGNAQTAIIDDDPNAQAGQTAVVVPATKSSGCQDVPFQVQFFTRPGGWPRMSTNAVLNSGRGHA